MKIRNPNLEIRSKIERQNPNKETSRSVFCFFGFRICFGFRISDFGFLAICVLGPSPNFRSTREQPPAVVELIKDDSG